MKKQTKTLIVVALLLGASVYFESFLVAFADDDERRTGSYQREEKEDDDDDDDDGRYVAPSPAPSTPVQEVVVTTTPSAPVETTQSVPKTTYVTVTDPSTYVTELQNQTVSKKDSDRDGLIDEVDPNPAVAEYYIVQDGDGNGINDLLEYAAQ